MTGSSTSRSTSNRRSSASTPRPRPIVKSTTTPRGAGASQLGQRGIWSKDNYGFHYREIPKGQPLPAGWREDTSSSNPNKPFPPPIQPRGGGVSRTQNYEPVELPEPQNPFAEEEEGLEELEELEEEED